MTLPNISIPEIPLPFELPELLHPAIVHFIIAIPIVVLLLELYNLVLKRRSISVFSLFLLIIVVVAMVGGYLTGGVDGKAAWDLLGTEGQSELKEHKLLGMYLTYGALALVAFKLLFMALRKTIGRVLFVVILIGFIGVTLKQGKDGGELVYKYGANNEMIADLKEKYEELLESSKEAQATSTVVPTPVTAPTAVKVESVSKVETNTTDDEDNDSM
ncbi:MAG: hypothetical protein KU29_04110 [Sulfurovum sp. FS06-10]|nr:MAG: hypothetical protein KU29_04110 [Sulfurovum sp. FS06-10]